MLLTVLAFVVALGVLVTFHELGHYWVARLCGVRIERFSVGFGRVLLRRYDRHGTEWALSAIPLGGYVKMMDEALPGATDQVRQGAFNTKPVWQRSAIVVAGPAANLLLAVLLYAMLGMMGSSEPAAILARPAQGSPAAHAGIQQGDKVVQVGNAGVQSWNELRWHLLDALSLGGKLALQVQSSDGVVRERVLDVPASKVDPDAPDLMQQAGLALNMPPPRIRQVEPDGAGALAGLRADDVLVQAGDIAQPSAAQVVQLIQRSADAPVRLTVLRDGVQQDIQVVPRSQDGQQASQGRIGIMLATDFPMVDVRYGPLDSLWRGVIRTADTVWFSLRMMGRMLVGDVSLKNVSGPVTIADYAGQTARVGLSAYIGFLALISVSIGVLNLLPIPMLDGGHLMYYLFEAIRGKPLSDRWQEHGQRIGIGMLAALMALAFFNDLARLFG